VSGATIISLETAPADESFPSAAALRGVHSNLLRRERAEGSAPTFLADVASFIQRGRITGKILDENADRRACQSMLDYWATVLYRASEATVDSTLDEFDPALAPILPEDLCPYVGLEAFREANRDRFFGRRRLIADLVGKLHEHRFLAVVGPSGSGKSSLMLGGLLPALKAGALPESDIWHYFPAMVPGSDPLANLARVVRPPAVKISAWIERLTNGALHDRTYLARVVGALTSQPVVLVIDQFEEMFTLCTNQQTVHAFIDNLLVLTNAQGARHTVILTMRSDFETYVARLPPLQALFEHSQARVTPMSAPELREAIEEPARQAGLKIEPRVVEALISDIIGEPAALPLLQFTLLKLWDQREHNRVSWDTYQRVGGGRLALARSADAFYNELSPEQQRTTRRILLRMVRPAAGLEFTSNRIRRAQLYQGGEAAYRIDEVLDKLVRARLIRLTAGDQPDDTQIEVAHEALVRNWPKLVDWLEEEREALRERQRLTLAAENWKSRGEDRSTLVRGAVLSEALRLPAADLSRIERDFLRASLQARLDEELDQEAARRREIEQARALAEEQRLRAEAERLRAEEQLRRAQAEHRQTQERSRAEAERLRAEEQARARRFLRILAGALAVALILSLIAGVIAFQSSIYATQQQTAAQTEVANRSTAEIQAKAAQVQSQADASTLATQVAIRGTAEAQAKSAQAQSQAAANRSATQVAISDTAVTQAKSAQAQSQADANTRATAEAQAVTARAIAEAEVATRTAAEQMAVAAQAAAQAAAELSARAEAEARAALAAQQTAVANTGIEEAKRNSAEAQILIREARALLQRENKSSLQRALQLAIAASDRDPGGPQVLVVLWEALQMNVPTPMRHGSEIARLVWSPDGHRVVSASTDDYAYVWDAGTAKQMVVSPKHGGTLTSVAWSPPDQRIVSTSAGNIQTALIWDAETGKQLQVLQGHTGTVLSAAWSPNGQLIVTTGADRTIRIWESATGKQLHRITGVSGLVLPTAWSPDGKYFVVATDNGATIWNETLEEQPRTIATQVGPIQSAAWSPNGTQIVTASSNTARIWNAQTGEQIGAPFQHSADVNSAVWSPSGNYILTACDDYTAQIWDIANSNRPQSTLRGSSEAIRIADWSRDNGSIVIGAADGILRVYPVSVDRALVRALQLAPRLNDEEIKATLEGNLLTPTLVPTSTITRTPEPTATLMTTAQP
jgi:WD40 repeat protein